MSYIVNGADWDFNGLTSAQASAKIDVALAFIEATGDRGLAVAVGDDFQDRPMHGSDALWDLFAPGSELKLDRDLANEIAAWLNRAPRYSETSNWPTGFGVGTISINGTSAVKNDDVEWVHCSVLAGEPVACLTINEPAVKMTLTSIGAVDVHFVSDEVSRRRFWRAAVDVAGDTLESLIRFAPEAFPDLYFLDGALTDASALSGGYLAHRTAVRKALAALDDWGRWAFIHPPPAKTPTEGAPPDPNARPTNQLIEHRFRGLHLDAAPENPKVFKDKISREARQVSIMGRTLYCEWHIKLQPHQNRIHIHAPVPESGDRVVIAVVHEHLPLP